MHDDHPARHASPAPSATLAELSKLFRLTSLPIDSAVDATTKATHRRPSTHATASHHPEKLAAFLRETAAGYTKLEHEARAMLDTTMGLADLAPLLQLSLLRAASKPSVEMANLFAMAASASGNQQVVPFVARAEGSVIALYGPYIEGVHTSSEATQVGSLDAKLVRISPHGDDLPDYVAELVYLEGVSNPRVVIELTWAGSKNDSVQFHDKLGWHEIAVAWDNPEYRRWQTIPQVPSAYWVIAKLDIGLGALHTAYRLDLQTGERAAPAPTRTNGPVIKVVKVPTPVPSPTPTDINTLVARQPDVARSVLDQLTRFMGDRIRVLDALGGLALDPGVVRAATHLGAASHPR